MAAARHERPDIVPIDTSFLDLVHVERITGKRPAGTVAGGGAWGFSPEDSRSDLVELGIRNQELTLEATRKIGLDSFAVSDYWLLPKGYRHKFIDKDTYVDHWGKVYRIRRDIRTAYWIDGIIRAPEDLDKFVPPDPNELCYDIVDFTVKEAHGEYAVLGLGHCRFIPILDERRNRQVNL